MSKRIGPGEIVVTIDASGQVRMQIVGDETPGHGERLVPFQEKISDGDAKLVHEHRHDHGHTHTHEHQGGGH